MTDPVVPNASPIGTDRGVNCSTISLTGFAWTQWVTRCLARTTQPAVIVASGPQARARVVESIGVRRARWQSADAVTGRNGLE
eukprot:1790078-Rhodomonas_salina.6